MNTWIKKNINTILIIFILLQPILDLITGISIHLLNLNITIGIVIRMLFLFFIIYCCLFIYHKKKNGIYYGLLFLYFILYCIGMVLGKGTPHLLPEIQGLLRVFYFPILFLSLYSIREHLKLSKMTLFVVLMTYLICILIPNILNLGFQSYEITKVGTLGFFNSANEISGIISILTPILLLILMERKNYLVILITGILYFFVIMTIGTKTPLLSLIITGGFVLLWYWGKSFKQRNYKVIGTSCILVIILSLGMVFILPKTNFYKNIKTHLNYLKVDDLGEVLESPKLIDHFIFSQRLTFLKNKQKVYNQAPTYQKIFGIGYLKNEKEMKAIEMDYFDIYYSHGIIGFILYFGLYGYLLVRILKEKKPLNFSQYMLYISLLLIIFLSLFTGHIITAPAVSLLVIIILLLLEQSQKKRLVFTAYNLKIGGIETALVNLINKINLDKYEVTIILEKKEGELQERINPSVSILESPVSNHSNKIIRKGINLYRQLKNKVMNYDTYDFSCCYATYSLSGNKLAKVLSKNNSIYIHSNYKQLYKTEKDLREFFDPRKLSEFCHIIFVSKESQKDYLDYYKDLEEKTTVINNFININEIIEKSKETISLKKDPKKKLFVFVGRLDDSSKKVSRAIQLIKNLPDSILWIVGDGPDKEKYQQEIKKEQVEKRIQLLGSKLNPYPYMKEADYIILTSDYEGFPVTYLEAIVLEKELITTIPVSDETLIIGTNYGKIIPKEEQKMIQVVKKLLQEKNVKEKIDLEKIQIDRMKQLEKIFDGVM